MTCRADPAAQVADNGWQVNSLWTFHGGLPFSVTATNQNSGNGESADRANQIGNPFAGVNHSIVNGSVQWFNTAAFEDPALGTYGTSGRGQYGIRDSRTSTSRCSRTPSSRAAYPSAAGGDVQHLQPHQPRARGTTLHQRLWRHDRIDVRSLCRRTGYRGG